MLSLKVFALITASYHVAALSELDVASVFPGTLGLTGGARALPSFNMTVVANSTHALISLNGTTPVDQVGWWATAVGTTMGNADFLVAWPSVLPGQSTLSWVLSHRQSTGFVQPLIASTLPTSTSNNFFTVIPTLSTSDPGSPWTAITFLRPLQMPSNYETTSPNRALSRGINSFLYASCSKRPPSVDEAAPIAKHDQSHASVDFDLGMPLSLDPKAEDSNTPAWTAESWPAGRPGEGMSPLTRRDKILAAHAGIGSIALLLFSPLAILIARYTRNLLPWFRIHATIQIGAYALIALAFSLGVSQAKSPHFSNSHTRLGLVIFTFLSAQIALGVVAHKTPAFRTSVTPPDPNNFQTTAFETIKGKPFVRLAHIAFGLTITILGWCQIRLGLEEWVDYSDSGNPVPTAVLIIFWALVGVESAEVFLGRFMKEEMNHDAVNRALSSRYNSSSRVNSQAGTGADMARTDTEGTVGTNTRLGTEIGCSSTASVATSSGGSMGVASRTQRERDSDAITVVNEPGTGVVVVEKHSKVSLVEQKKID